MTQEQTRKRAKTAILKMLAAAEQYFAAEAVLHKQREQTGAGRPTAQDKRAVEGSR